MEKLDENSLFDKFLKFEEQYHFFDIEYKGILVWEIARFFFYSYLQTEIKGLSPSLPALKQVGTKEINDEIKSKLLNLDNLKHYDILLMGNPRRILQQDGKYYDITTDFIPEILDKYSCLTIEDPFWGLLPSTKASHSLPSITKNIVYLDSVEENYFNNLYSQEFNEDRQNIYNLLNPIANIFNNEWGIDVNGAIEMSTNRLLYCIHEKDLYTSILKKIQPKVVMLFFHVHHTEWLMTKVAKELHIPVIEIQHGIIGEFEPIWHRFNSTPPQNVCLPDYIFSFSPKLVNKEHFALKDKIKYVGYPFLYKKIEQYKDICYHENNKNILIISQANISDDLSNFTKGLAEMLLQYPEYHIYYKLHPYELEKQFDNLNYPNVTIVRDLKKDVYYYQSICDIQIGVYSTALYEGIMFNTTSIIVKDLLGWKESYNIMKDLNGVFVAKTPQQAFDIILSNPAKTPTNNNLWGSFSKTTYNKYIKEIIDATK